MSTAPATKAKATRPKAAKPPKAAAPKAEAPKAEAPKAEAPAPKARPTKAAADDRRYQQAAIRLKQASDVTRLKILTTLAAGEQNVGELCALLGQSQPACSHHLALMRHGGLIAPRRQGKNNLYTLTDDGRALADAVRVVIG